MAAIGQTITVVNKSGKVVKTSKHLANVFKEAKSAYLEKKAELKAAQADELSRKASAHASESGRTSPPSPRPSHKEDRDRHRSSKHSSRRSSHDYRDDDRDTSSRTSTRRHDSHKARARYDSDHSSRPPLPERGYTDSFYTNDDRPPTTSKHIRRTSTQPLTSSNLRHATSPTTSPTTPTHESTELARRRSTTDVTTTHTTIRRGRGSRTSSISRSSSIDPDLAYGDLPPPPIPLRPSDTTDEIRGKMTALQKMLQEAECAQHSAKAVIKSLESNPDAMAAVALTLAEISNLATKMAPGALMTLKGSFPVVVGLLLSPEFLIAGGVALGVTVVSFGGYKIVKRMKLKKREKRERALTEAGEGATVVDGEDGEEEEDGDELEEIGHLDRIEQWRRGIQLEGVEADRLSVGTSVEGEFVTPKASRMLRDEGVLEEKRPKKKEGKAEKEKSKKEKPKDRSGDKGKDKGESKKDRDLAKREKELEKREKELARKEKEADKKHEQVEKAKARKDQKQIKSVVDAEEEQPKQVRDVQAMLKGVFKKDKEKEIVKGEVVA